MGRWAKLWVVATSLACGATLGLGAQEKEHGPSVITGFLKGCQILGSRSKGNLSIVAVQGESRSLPSITTLDEVMPTGKLVIKETSDSGTVNTLVLQNHSKQTVFIMAGEILAGAKQDRILQQDVLLPPKSKPIHVSAFCVEHGRWQTKSAAFYSEKNAAPISVRNMAQVKADQSAVWAEVAVNNDRLGAVASTGTLSATYKGGKLAKDKDKYLPSFSDMPAKFPKATGAIVLVNGKVLAADLFGDRRIFERLWKKLLDSYIAEAVRRDGDKASEGIPSAESMMKTAAGGRVDLKATPGAGKQINLRGSALKGSGIALEVPIHVDLFPTQGNDGDAPRPLIRNQSRQ